MRPTIRTWEGQKINYVQLKYDGHYTEVRVTDDKEVQVLTRRPIDITLQVYMMPFMRPFYRRVPANTIVLGELHVQGHTSSDVKTAIIERWPNLGFTAFAIETEDEDAPLESVEDLCLSWGLQYAKYRPAREEDRPETLISRIPSFAEGFVVKQGNLSGWYKVKPELTADLVITGFTEGDGKYAGLIGSISGSVYSDGKLVEVANVSGMTDATRIWLTDHMAELRGSVFEVCYQNVGSRGRLRHPRFVQMREDKPPIECTKEQLNGGQVICEGNSQDLEF